MFCHGNVAFRRRLSACCFSLFSNLDLNPRSGDTSFKTRLETLRPFGTRIFVFFVSFLSNNYAIIITIHRFKAVLSITPRTPQKKIEETADQRNFSKKKKLCDIAITCAIFPPRNTPIQPGVCIIAGWTFSLVTARFPPLTSAHPVQKWNLSRRRRTFVEVAALP